ncbi:hypothetical protein Scep_007754 [Stephania cephalantha]|uniref:Uncharacterized protein n=1 Tax=Stephania cephalantha TaxID=152367 RepID=A0AAP0KD62_9MAGN
MDELGKTCGVQTTQCITSSHSSYHPRCNQMWSRQDLTKYKNEDNANKDQSKSSKNAQSYKIKGSSTLSYKGSYLPKFVAPNQDAINSM